MQSRLEVAIENAVVRWAKAHGVLALKLNLQGSKGWPDRMFLHGGRVLFMEFKKPGEQPYPLQEYRHRALRALGFTVSVHDDRNTAIAELEAAFLSGAGG